MWGCQHGDLNKGTIPKALIEDGNSTQTNLLEKLPKTDVEEQLERDAASPLLTSDQLKAVRQHRKLRTDAETRDMFKHAQTVGIFFMVIGLLAAALIADVRKWGLVSAIGGIVVILVSATLSYYIEIWRPIVALILFLLFGGLLVFSALWVKQRKLLAQVIDTTERVKKRLKDEGQENALAVVKEELRKNNDSSKIEITQIKARQTNV
jgi:hypothetical protein